MRTCKFCKKLYTRKDPRAEYCDAICKGKHAKLLHRERNRDERRRLNTNGWPLLDNLIQKPWTTLDFYQKLSKNW